MKRTLLSLSAISLVLAGSTFAYGPTGHQIVGAIADERLANTPAGKQVSALLDGIPLEKAAVIPDEIKGWDKKGADDPNIFHYSLHPKIDAQLRDFWRANQPTHEENPPAPSHHWFHYTDVPLMPVQKYAEGKTGRSKWDIVHMMSYCVEVLQGSIPEENERKITKPIAIILLAHYAGDIHQPLHVGAEYFDQKGHVVDPDKEEHALEDQGGNTLSLKLASDPPFGRLSHTANLHGFWDLDTVMALLPPVPETATRDQKYAQVEPAKKTLAHDMAAHEPKDWRMPADLEPKKYAEAWADEIMPIARAAHERLVFKNVQPKQQDNRVIAAGQVEEGVAPDKVAYLKWASAVVRTELHKAGWRLADLLEKSLAAKKENAAPSATSTPED